MINAAWYGFCINSLNLPVNSNIRGGKDEQAAKGRHGSQATISTGCYHPDDSLRIDRDGDRYRRSRRKTLGHAGDARITRGFLPHRERRRCLIPEKPRDRREESVLLVNLKKLCNFQFRQGSTGPLADPDPSPSAFFVFPSVACAPSFQTFEEEALNLHSPAPFLPRTSFHECSIDRDHLRPPAVEGQVIHIAETRRFYFSN